MVSTPLDGKTRPDSEDDSQSRLDLASPFGDGARQGRKKRKLLYSAFLGCHVEHEKKCSKTAMERFTEHFALWIRRLREHTAGECHTYAGVVKDLMVAHQLSEAASLHRDLRALIARERRDFLYAKDSTSSLMTHKKVLNHSMQTTRAEMDAVAAELEHREAQAQAWQEVGAEHEADRWHAGHVEGARRGHSRGSPGSRTPAKRGPGLDILTVDEEPDEYEAMIHTFSDRLSALSRSLQVGVSPTRPSLGH